MNQCTKRNLHKISKGIRKLPLFLLKIFVIKRRLEREEVREKLLRDKELEDKRILQHNLEL